MIPVLASIGFISVSTLGLMSFVGFMWAVFLIWKKFKQEHFDDEQIFDLAFLGLLWGVVGARLMYVFLHLSQFGLHFVKWFMVSDFNQMYWLGFIVGIYWFVVISAKKNKWQKYEILDWLVPGILMAQVWVNFGHFLAGDILGKISKMPWAVYHPNLQQKLHPIGLYLALLFLLEYFLVIWLEKHYRLFTWYQDKRGTARPGFVWIAFLLVNFLIQFFISFFTNKSDVFLYLSWYQIILFISILSLIPIFLERSGRWSFIDWWQSLLNPEEEEPIRKPMVLKSKKPEQRTKNSLTKKKRRFVRAKVGTTLK